MKLLGILTVVGLLTLSTQGASGSCKGLLARVSTVLGWPRDKLFAWRFPEAKTFSRPAFDDALQRYSVELRQGGSDLADHPPRTIEEKAAFLQAVLQGYKTGPGSLADMLDRRGERTSLGSLLGDLDFEKGLSRNQLDRVIATLFLRNHLSPTALRSIARKGWEGSVHQLLRLQLEMTLARQGLEQAVLLLDGIRPQTKWERTREISARILSYSDVLFTPLGMMPVLGGHLPVYIPGWSPLRNAKVQREILEKAMKHGVDSVYPDFIAQYKTRAQAELAYGSFRKGYLLAMLVSYLAQSMEDSKKKLDKADEQKKDAEEKKDKLAAGYIEEGKSAKEKAADDIFDKWKKDFKNEKGRPPTKEEIDFIRLLQQE